GEGQDMVGIVIGQMDLEQMQALVNPLDEAEPPGQEMEGTDASVSDAAGAVADLVVNVAGREHGLRTTTEVGLIEAALDPTLAGLELLVYRGVHSKTLDVGVHGETVYS